MALPVTSTRHGINSRIDYLKKREIGIEKFEMEMKFPAQIFKSTN